MDHVARAEPQRAGHERGEHDQHAAIDPAVLPRAQAGGVVVLQEDDRDEGAVEQRVDAVQEELHHGSELEYGGEAEHEEQLWHDAEGIASSVR
jgi:hypothetical protein